MIELLKDQRLPPRLGQEGRFESREESAVLISEDGRDVHHWALNIFSDEFLKNTKFIKSQC